MAIATGLVCGFAAFWITTRQEPWYTASSTVFASQSGSGLAALSYAPAELDAAAYGLAAVSNVVLRDAIVRLGGTPGDPVNVNQLKSSLDIQAEETSTSLFITFTVKAPNPSSAAATANAVAEALVAWDADRARADLSRAADVLESQLASLLEESGQENSQQPLDAVAREEWRSNLVGQLTYVRALQANTQGNLTMFEAAQEPSNPTLPALIVNSAVGFVLGVVLGYAIVLIYSVFREERSRSPIRATP